jgi:hypothetical protein
LLHDAIGGRAGDVDPRAEVNVENLAEPCAFSRVDAYAGLQTTVISPLL